MKFFSSLFVIVICGLGVLAQQEARVVATIAGSDAVKNSPFSADAISESVQTLADGNRIVRISTSKLYRNSEGRIRREMAKGSTGGGFGTFFNFDPGVTIMDPVGSKFLLDSRAKIATEMSMLPMRDLNIVSGAKLTEAQKAQIRKLKELGIKDGQPLTAEQKAALDKVRAELKMVEPRVWVPGPGTAGSGVVAVGGGSPFTFSFGGPEAKYETKSEDLGTRDIEGVQAEGTRRITTIPAGAIGNERPIETVYERWYSKDLGVVVMSKNADPRFGEQTYRLTNIVRAEPDPSLFSVPSGYKVISGEGDNGYYYRINGVKGTGKATVYTTKP